MTRTEQVLVTGGYGCIGAETTKWLLRYHDCDVVIGSRSVSESRTARVFAGIDTTRLTVRQLDVTSPPQLDELFAEHRFDRVVHLAALQTPDCNARRDLGLQINLAGTQHLIEAIKTYAPQLRRFVFASSIAVYGPRDRYPAGRVPMLADPEPVNVYGVWKLAGEQLTRILHTETGIDAISLRPGVLYGPGRDRGLTSTPTTAMKHRVLGRPYEIPFCSRQDYLYAPDVGAAFAIAATAPFSGHGVFTLPSTTRTTDEIVAAMRNAAEQLQLPGTFAISIGHEQVPFICDLEYQPFLDLFDNVPQTPLADAVRESLTVFQQQAERGWLEV